MTADLRTMLDVAEMTHSEDMRLTTFDLDLDDITDPHAALAIWRAADRQAKAAKLVKDVAGIRLAELLGNGGAAAAGDIIVRYKQCRKERCTDPEGFTAYVTRAVVDGDVKLDAVWSANTAKRTWMPEAVRDTFFEWVEDDTPRLTEVPRLKAPKWLQSLADGDVIIKEHTDE